tara:strand:+ start:2749 stop:2964 length:216 start_codon:yes stop_codon:yes gene_type:complete
MTTEQFEALVKLMRGDPESSSNQAAKRVLVDGISQADAMRETGSKRNAVSNAVSRYRKADDLMRHVYGVPK